MKYNIDTKGNFLLSTKKIPELDKNHILFKLGILKDLDGAYHNYPLISKDDISKLAYYLWESSGCPIDDGTGFWLEAERMLGGPHTEQKG